jgi:hypothetical protein
MVHQQKVLLLCRLDQMTENRFAEQLAAKLRIRFATTADGARCEAAAILTRDGHEQYSRYVSSWGNEDANLSEAFGRRLQILQATTPVSGKRFAMTLSCFCLEPIAMPSVKFVFGR